MESLGTKLQHAREAKDISIDDAARATKIRAARLADLEREDFSNFPSLTYAKGFLLIYGKFLGVDVSPYLEAFEASKNMTVDGYSYLEDNPLSAPAPIAPRPTNKAPVWPLVVFLGVLVGGFLIAKLYLDIQRTLPGGSSTAASPSAAPVALATPSPAASIAPTETLVAPRALPVDSPAADVAMVAASPRVAPPAPTVAVLTPTPAPSATEPEVRRAEPVHPEDLVNFSPVPGVTASASAAPPAGANEVQVRPLKKTYVKVIVDNNDLAPAFDRWLSPSEGAVKFRGQRIAIRVLDRAAVEIKKNGQLLQDSNSNVTVE